MFAKKLRGLLAVLASSTLIVACGGGGGDSSAASGEPHQRPSASTSPENVGLHIPTLPIPNSPDGAITLVEEVVQAFSMAELAQATKSLGTRELLGAAQPVDVCKSGGLEVYVSSTNQIFHTYNQCSDGQFLFTGLSQLSPEAGTDGKISSQQVRFEDLKILSPAGDMATLTGTVKCGFVHGSAGATTCVTQFRGFRWGLDFSFDANGAASGSSQCDGNIDWHMIYRGFGATSGQADLFGVNGSATVTRTGAKTFVVDIFVDSGARRYNVTLP